MSPPIRFRDLTDVSPVIPIALVLVSPTLPASTGSSYYLSYSTCSYASAFLASDGLASAAPVAQIDVSDDFEYGALTPIALIESRPEPARLAEPEMEF